VSVADDRTRVCPRCGTPAEAYDVCTACGTHLAGLPELPTRSDWESRRRVRPTQRPITPASIRPLLHPSERSRLVIATVAAAVAVGFLVLILILAGTANLLLPLVGTLAVTTVSIWLGQQVRRARLLGRSVKVGPDTMPELQALLEDVARTLQYDRRVDVYVVDKATQPLSMSSYLGTRIIVIEGSLVAELLQPERRSQLVFLLGRSIGALRAKHARLDIIVVLLDAINVLKYVTPFLLPWYRATAYSGDQIGMVCCADLEAALQATRRLLIGKELAAELDAGIVLPQASLVQRRLLPRFVQLFGAEPHTTNRYANLLCFGRYHDPASWERLRGTMGEEHLRSLEQIWARSPYRRRVAAYRAAAAAPVPAV
jgi:hypothetical protein